MTEPVAPTMENIALTLDNGAVLDFRGRLFSEASWFDEDSGVLNPPETLFHGRKRAGLFRCQRHRQNAQPAERTGSRFREIPVPSRTANPK